MANLLMEDIEDEGLQRTNPALVNIVQEMNDELAARGYSLTVTGGARSAEHNAEVNGDPNSKHLTGNAVDLYAEVPDGLLEELAEKHGANYLWHDAGTGMHFHLQIDDDYTPPDMGAQPTSILHAAAATAGRSATSGVYAEHEELPDDPIDYDELAKARNPEKVSFWSALSQNFMGSFTSTGSAYVIQQLFGDAAHSGWIYRPVSQEDIDYVKTMLPDDKEAQEFCLLHGQDAEEVRWLVNQRLVDKRRQADVARWRAETDSMLQKGAVALAGATGMFLDPILLVPHLSAFNSSKMLGRLGISAIENVSKARQICNAVAKSMLETGTEQALVMFADDSMRSHFGGQKVDFGTNAMMAFLGGSAIRSIGAIRGLGREVAALDRLETEAMRSAIALPEAVAPVGLRRALGRKTYKDVMSIINKDIANKESELFTISERLGTKDAHAVLQEAVRTGAVPKRLLKKLRAREEIMAKAQKREPTIRSEAEALDWLKKQDLSRGTIPVGAAGSETHKFAQVLHDADLVKKYNSKVLNRFVENGRVVVTTSEHAGQLVEKMSGQKIPETAKSFYVPNEDYAFLLADRVAPEEVNSVLAHEFAIHGGLLKTIGKDAYNQLMARIHEAANKQGTAFFKARQAIQSHDPEEILAHMVEAGTIPSKFVDSMRSLLRKALGKDGVNISFTREDVAKLLSQQMDAKREAALGIHFNPDGSTAFAGLQFSRNSLFNVNLWNDLYALEAEIAERTQQGWYMKHLPEFAQPYARKFTKALEQGYFGQAYTSASNTMRELAGKLWEDARGRGAYRANTVAAETHKEMLKREMYKGIFDYIDARTEALGQYAGRFSREKALAFDKAVMRYYNAKYANHIAGGVLEDMPEGVKKAAEILNTLRERQIALGKNSSRMVGSKYDNLIEDDWMPVDCELWRHIDKDARMKLLSHANTKEELELLEAQIAEYAERYAMRDAVKKQLEREAKLMVQRGDASEVLPITDDMVEQYIKGEAKAWAHECMDVSGIHDIQSKKALNGELGDLPFFRKRLPIDTSGIMEFNIGGNRFEFSFDESLRDFDLTKIMQQNAERFSGEAAVKAVFGGQRNVNDALSMVQKELATASSAGHGSKDWKIEFENLKEGIQELRGMRAREDIMTRNKAAWRFLQNISYAKNGANMLWAQLAETGGTMAYGGVRRVFDTFPPLRRLMNDFEYGKVTGETLRETEDMMFGFAQESRIFGTSYGDRMVREQLTSGSLTDRMLRGVNDFAATMGKVTSTVNMLPMVTESMMKGMRAQTLIDCIRWAEGKTFGKLRNPFSEAKLKAARLTEENVALLKEHINNYVTKDAEGNLLKLDVERWQAENAVTYSQFWNLIQNQAERAIVSGTRIGNRNLFKNMNTFTRMMFQFKDYTLRAINGQTMRSLTAGDVDDAVATGLSILTNSLSYGARCAATYQMMKAAGLDEKAEQYRQRMFNDEQLARVIAVRSTILGSPLSMVNDVYEAVVPNAATIRTTVSRPNQPDRPIDVGNVVGNAITQLPAIKEASVLPIQALQAAQNIGTGRGTQRDIMRGLRMLPIPQLIPLNVLYQKLSASSGLPERLNTQKPKREKRKAPKKK